MKDLNEVEDFRLDEANYSLVGLRSGTTFRIGDKVKIKLVSANLLKRQLDYHWVREETNKEGKKSETTGKKKAKKGK